MRNGSKEAVRIDGALPVAHPIGSKFAKIMSKTGKLKIAISGYLGTGKSTLAQELASRLDLQVVREDAAAIAESEETYRLAAKEALGDSKALLALKQNSAHRYLEWANARSRSIEEAERLVTDRWHADLLIWWLLAFRGFRGSAETFSARLRNETIRIARELDFIVITPLQPPFVPEGETNEDGFARAVNGSDHLLFQTLLTGILAEVPQAKIILLPVELNSAAERADYIARKVAQTETATPAVLH